MTCTVPVGYSTATVSMKPTRSAAVRVSRQSPTTRPRCTSNAPSSDWGPVTRVLELPPSRPPGDRGAGREAPRQGLHARFLVDREHHRPRGRMQVQVGDRRHLLPKLGVGTVQPAPHPVRPQLADGQNPLIATPADPRHEVAGCRLLHQRGNRPRRPPVLPLNRLAGQGNQLQAGDWPKLRRGPGPGAIRQPGEPGAPEPGPPAFDGARMDPHVARHGRGTARLRAGQDDPGTHRVALGRGPRSNSPLEFGALRLVPHDLDARPSAPAHAPTGSLHPLLHQLFRSPRPSLPRVHFSGGISGSDH